METTLIDWLHQLGTLEFWEALLEGFEGLGPLVPILLAMLESIFPPLPLIAIVALNVAAHGGIFGFLYSWIGVAVGGTLVYATCSILDEENQLLSSDLSAYQSE